MFSKQNCTVFQSRIFCEAMNDYMVMFGYVDEGVFEATDFTDRPLSDASEKIKEILTTHDSLEFPKCEAVEDALRVGTDHPFYIDFRSDSIEITVEHDNVPVLKWSVKVPSPYEDMEIFDVEPIQILSSIKAKDIEMFTNAHDHVQKWLQTLDIELEIDEEEGKGEDGMPEPELRTPDQLIVYVVGNDIADRLDEFENRMLKLMNKEPLYQDEFVPALEEGIALYNECKAFVADKFGQTEDPAVERFLNEFDERIAMLKGFLDKYGYKEDY